jgi:hypothetical protein
MANVKLTEASLKREGVELIWGQGLDSDSAGEVEAMATPLPESCGAVAELRPARHARRGEARQWLESFLVSVESANITDECVLWPFSTNRGAGGHYPQVRIGDKTVRVTRYLFERMTGRRLVARELIRHSCDIPRCVNPWHFDVGDHVANMRDMVERRRSASGERNGRSRLTEADVRDIRAFARDRDLRGGVASLAREHRVSVNTMRLILAGETWREAS